MRPNSWQTDGPRIGPPTAGAFLCPPEKQCEPAAGVIPGIALRARGSSAGSKPVRIENRERQPAPTSPEMRMVEWREIRPEGNPNVLATHQPVRRNCPIAGMHIS